MKFSDLEVEWHPTLNFPLIFNPTLIKSRKYWWVGKCGHEWNATLANRIRGRGCPVCAGLRIQVGFNDLESTYPLLSAEWHPTKNGKLTPQEVTIGSSKKVWWLGTCGHEWEAQVSSRTKQGTGCSICSGRRTLAGFNDLRTTHPDVAALWHPTKNGELTPEQVSIGSNKKIWWLTDCGHCWDSTIISRIKSKNICSVCFGKKLHTGFNDLASTNPTLAAEWHPIRNDLTAEQITAGSGKKAWWLGKCGHEWEASIHNRTKGKGCPICSGRKTLAGFNDLKTTHPDLATEWHPVRNGELTPAHTTYGNSTNKFWWLGKCGHEWEATAGNRAQGFGCPVCAGLQVLVGFNDLVTINPVLAAEWHPTKNGELAPEQITAGTDRKVWWLGACGHEWDANVSSRRNSVGKGCPVCQGFKVLIGFNDLATINPVLAAEWHPTKNGDLAVNEVFAGGKRKGWWLGICGHEWQASIEHRIRRGDGCPKCSRIISKAEKQIKEYLEGMGVIVEGSDRTILNGKEIDIWLPEQKIGIEFNGIYWHSEKYRGQEFHYDKWLSAKRAGIQLMQIWEDDWNLRGEIIRRTLANKLEAAKNEPTSRETKITSVSEQQAEQFLGKNHLHGFNSGYYYVGIVETGDIDKLQAVMVFDKEPNSEGNSLEITRYASIANVTENFTKLLSHAVNAYIPESITVLADHCEANEKLYENNGFIAEKELPPDYMYVIRAERKPRSEYSLERFRDDPALKWKDGLNEMELADLNGLNRIWDAGKTLYRLVL